jgi:hypothetical protein
MVTHGDWLCWLATSSKLPLLQKHSEQPYTEPKKHQQTNKTINQTHAQQQHNNPHNLEYSEAYTKKKSKPHYKKATDSFITAIYTPVDGQLGQNI